MDFNLYNKLSLYDNISFSYKQYCLYMFKKRNKQATTIDVSEIQQSETNQPSTKDNSYQKQKQQAQQKSLPSKKVKLDKLNQIGGSTTERSKQMSNTTHQQFQSLHYFNPNKKDSHKSQKEKQDERILAGEEAEKTQSQLAKQRYLQQVETTKLIKEGKLSNKIYRGQNSYANYKLTEEDLEKPSQSYKWKHGPARASGTSGAQNTCRFDYDPSLCKDWHDSGYCVFGNSCLYLHDRSNYKTGWQQEKDFERSQRERWKRINNPDIIEEQDYIKDLQKFKVNQICSYCNQAYKVPVQTTCRHIFCLTCLEKMNKKQKKCITCSKKLDGIMNNAQKALKKQKEQYEEMLKVAEKNQQISLGKRSKYRNLNSLQVFNNNQ